MNHQRQPQLTNINYTTILPIASPSMLTIGAYSARNINIPLNPDNLFIEAAKRSRSKPIKSSNDKPEFDFSEPCPNFTNSTAANAFAKRLWDFAAKQEAELHQALEKLGKNSSNSSISSSQESLSNKAKQNKNTLNGKQHNGRKQGAQKGHIGHGRKLLLSEQCDIIVSCFVPSHCNCGCQLPQGELKRRKQVFDINENQLTVTEYQLYQSICSCGKIHKGQLPADVPAGILSANSIAIVSSLTGKFKLSKRNACELLYDFFGLKISVGTVSNAEHIVANALKPAHQEAQAHIQTAPIRNSDETSFYYRHHQTWVWCAATPTVSYYQIEHSRSQQSAKTVLGEHHQGITIVDRCPSYSYIPNRHKQYCWSHLGRDITAVAERFNPEESRIGEKLQQTQYRIFNDYDAFIENSQDTGIKQQLFSSIREFHRILRQGKQLDKCKTQRFCRNLLKHFKCLWRFIHYPDVEPTNNHGEREIRPSVVYRKQSFGVQSLRGERYVERVLTVSRTCKKQHRSFIDFVRDSVKALWGQGEYPLLLQQS